MQRQAARVEKTSRSEKLLVSHVKCQNEVVRDDSAKPLVDSTAPVWTREVEEDVAATTINHPEDIPTTHCGSTLGMTFPLLVTLFLCMMKRIRRGHATHTGALCTAERGEPAPDRSRCRQRLDGQDPL